MKALRRPTIPLIDWRIASNLEASRAIQQHPDFPATGCGCDGCQRWPTLAQQILPTELRGQLERLGIQLEHPADLSTFTQVDGSKEYRVIYLIAGKLLSGPTAWREDAAPIGRVLTYKVLRQSPQYLAMVVLPLNEVPGGISLPESIAAGELLQIDLRAYIS